MASTDNNDLQQSNRLNANNLNFNLYIFHVFVSVLLHLKHGCQLLNFIAQAIAAYRLIINLQIIINQLYQLTKTTILTLLIILLSTCGIAISSNTVSDVIALSTPLSTSAQAALFYKNDYTSKNIATTKLRKINLNIDNSEQTENFLSSAESKTVNSSSVYFSAASYTIGTLDGVVNTPATNANSNTNTSNSNAISNIKISNTSKHQNSANKKIFTFHPNSTKEAVTSEVVVEFDSSSTILDSSNVTLFKTNNITLEKKTEVTGDDDPFRLPSLQAILVSIVLSFVILGTVVGNVLVCIAVCMVRKLRRPCNYLLVSLALSDLCVAVLVMPMALLYEVLQKWNFGRILCDVWVSFDVLCCTASILNLCAISVDRYLAITKPLEYGVKRTPRRMTLCVALVWLAAACISLPPLLILGNEHEDEQGEPVCAVCQNFAYQIYATLGSFYIPLAVMLFVYYQIFRAAHRIVLEEKRAQTHLQHALNGTGSTGSQPQTSTQPGSGVAEGADGNNQQLRHCSYGNTSLSYSACGVLTSTNDGSSVCVAGAVAGVSGSGNLLGSPHQKKIRFQLAKEKKASTTLGIIMSAFTICWLPFFILALIRPFVESESTHVPQSLSSLFLWLGYANSLLNPIIYATLNRDFRKPFQAILYFRCSSLNTMMRENYYQDQYGEPPSQRVMLGDERHGARESFL